MRHSNLASGVLRLNLLSTHSRPPVRLVRAKPSISARPKAMPRTSRLSTTMSKAGMSLGDSAIEVSTSSNTDGGTTR